MIKEIIPIVYNYFQLFIIVLVVIVNTVLRSRRLNWSSSLKVLLLGASTITITFIVAIPLARSPLFFDKMDIWLDKEQTATIDSIDFWGVSYLSIKILDMRRFP